jgi:hypothetical protein
MNHWNIPLWGWVVAPLLSIGIFLALQKGHARARLVGLFLCQTALGVTCLWGWGLMGASSNLPASPTAKAACWLLGSWTALSFLIAWVLGRRAWAEGLLASRSPKPGFRRQL